jgi:hypothetical protein
MGGMPDSILSFLKVLGIVLTGASGVIALGLKFRGDDGRITKPGKWALGVILVSTLFATSAQFWDSRKQATETLETVRRTETTLSEIRRGLYPIRDVSVDFWMDIPMDHVALRPYLDRFNTEAALIIPKLNEEGRYPGILGGSMDRGRNYTEFEFSSDSALAPRRDQEKLAHTILAYSELELNFYRKPVDPKDVWSISGSGGAHADLTMRVDGELADLKHTADPGRFTITYDILKKQFGGRAFMLPSDSKYWESTGQIISLTDLAGAQMMVDCRSVMISGDPRVDQYIPEIRKRVELRTLVISVAGGRQLWFREKDFKKLDDREGYPVYVYQFPQKVEDLNKLR